MKTYTRHQNEKWTSPPRGFAPPGFRPGLWYTGPTARPGTGERPVGAPDHSPGRTPGRHGYSAPHQPGRKARMGRTRPARIRPHRVPGPPQGFRPDRPHARGFARPGFRPGLWYTGPTARPGTGERPVGAPDHSQGRNPWAPDHSPGRNPGRLPAELIERMNNE